MTAIPTPTDASVSHPVDSRRWRALGVLVLVQFMLVLDVSVVNIALPAIQHDLGFSRAGLAWVVDAYVLVAGSLLLLGGRLSDVLGRRRMFLVGVGIFAAASIVCGAAQNPSTLVVSRLVQGAGEALAGPAAFGLIAVLFTKPAERTKAIGLFGGISGLAGTGGPILSGLLVQYATWRWIFALNIPIAVIAVVLVLRLIDPDRVPGGAAARNHVSGGHAPGRAGPAGAADRRVDVLGAVLATCGFSGIVYALIEAATQSWSSTRVLAPLIAGLVVLALFVGSQRVVPRPLLPLAFLAERTRVLTNAVTLLFYAVFLTQFFITTLYLQNVIHVGPLRAGLAFLPFGIAVGAAIGMGTALLPRIGLRATLTSGLLVTAGGVLLFTRISAHGSYLSQVLPASVVIAFGSGLCLPSLGNGAVHNVTERDAGLASGLQQAVQQIGGALGLATLATLALRHANDELTTGATPAAATTSGYVLAFRVGVGILLLASALAAMLGTDSAVRAQPAGDPTLTAGRRSG